MRTSRKDYERFARIFKCARDLTKKGLNPEGILDVVINDLADIFSENHATFDKIKFLQATGMEEVVIYSIIKDGEYDAQQA